MALYQALYRKWRPQTFDEVTGQSHITDTLKTQVASSRLSHAYLFTGTRGTGKTTCAKILARAVNCERPVDGNPCNQCPACRGILDGSILDVLELDAASNNGVDQVRALRDEAAYAPAAVKKRVYIIDEVHMLTPAAFNALLKTLEEPPPYAKFIFATTEGDKVLPTIISRCQRFDLRRIQTGQIVRRLEQICRAEAVQADQDALLAVARGAEGGMRDALSALDQLISFKGTSLTEQDVLSVFGLVSRKELETLAQAILSGDIPTILRQVDFYESSGKDLRRLLAELMTHFRNLLVYSQGGADLLGANTTGEQLQVLQQQTTQTDPKRILDIAGQLADLETKLRQSLSIRTLLEMGLIRCARLATAVPIDRILRQIAALRQQLPTPEAASQPPPEPPAKHPDPQPPTPPISAAKQPQNSAEARAAVYKDDTLRQAISMFDGRVVDPGA
ncbi:MAG: DNA polymerase III subunit gamma/tau [Kiritimatiellia bacterium]|nr:DNA polymerase III subunit gamma/tau [Kiritimatiellia bacterium]